MAASLEEADRLIATAKRSGRILQVGHVERFNPAVAAAQKIVSRPLFFEVHRLGMFTPRSLDIDVVYDVMIHDLDILLALVNAPVTDMKAVGIPVITEKVDIAQARIEFATGTVANLTASRVSTERVRKMRFFQEHEYISLDFTRQDALRVRVAGQAAPQPGIGFEKLPNRAEEPLRAELQSFLECVRTRQHARRRWRSRPPRARTGRPSNGGHPRSRAARPSERLRSSRNYDDSAHTCPGECAPRQARRGEEARRTASNLHGRAHRRARPALGRAAARRAHHDSRAFSARRSGEPHARASRHAGRSAAEA